MAATTSLKVAKAALRKDMKRIIASVPEESKKRQSDAVAAKLIQLQEYQRAKNISIYLHMHDEIQTLGILENALNSGKRCYIPHYFMDGRDMDMVLLHDMDDYHSLPLTKWKIKQPADDDSDDRENALHTDHGLDLVLVPGLAFTKDGARLGRGKGYYDTFLTKCGDSGKMPATVALAFREQVLESLPIGPHDFRIQMVLSP